MTAQIQLFNTRTKKIEIFSPFETGNIRMYSCGPTVYSRSHIGNMRSFLIADILKRTLRFFDYNVFHVMNITDVGHLTVDDNGDDKMELAAAREKKSATEIAALYTQIFLDDASKINIIRPDAMPRATEYIAAQIALIQKLEEKGFVYHTSDGLYFDTAQLPAYGSLSGQKNDEKKEGARVNANNEKRNASDFALWKFSGNSQRQMEWPSPWGVGFPGWHIECSAMSRELLGQPFDIHTGGIDLISPHHENEIAQSEAAFGVPLARFWVHGEFILINEQKMAKSESNFYTLDDLQAHGFEPLSFRYVCLNTHYRTPLHFSFDALSAAQAARKNIRDIVRQWKKPTTASTKWIKKGSEALIHDVNAPQLLALVWELIKSDENEEVKAATLLEFDKVLGLSLDTWIGVPLVVPPNIEQLAQKRNGARQAKNFEAADALRKEIETHGFLIEDNGANWTIREK